jgi:hypothetical protein
VINAGLEYFPLILYAALRFELAISDMLRERTDPFEWRFGAMFMKTGMVLVSVSSVLVS